MYLYINGSSIRPPSSYVTNLGNIFLLFETGDVTTIDFSHWSIFLGEGGWGVNISLVGQKKKMVLKNFTKL